MACGVTDIGHQDNETKNFQSIFQKSVAGIIDDLQREIIEFKKETVNNIEVKLTHKFSRYENEAQQITEKLTANVDRASQSERGNKNIVFGVPLEASDSKVTVLDRVSYDKKSVEDLPKKLESRH